MTSNVLPLHLKYTFPPIIWIFTESEGDGIKSRLPFKVFSTLTLPYEGSLSVYKLFCQFLWNQRKIHKGMVWGRDNGCMMTRSQILYSQNLYPNPGKKSCKMHENLSFFQKQCLCNARSGTKGQLISKGLFDVIVSTKKSNEIVLRISALASKKRSNRKKSLIK